MWNEYDHTYNERAEVLKESVLQLESQVEELKYELEIARALNRDYEDRLTTLEQENDMLRSKLSYNRNPEDAYREDSSYIGIRGIKTY